MPQVLRKTTRYQLEVPRVARATRATLNRWVSHVCQTHDQLAGSSVTYQLEWVKCGKARCNKWHGPYWYAYWTAGGKTRSLYVGKRLRPAADVATELVERRKNKRSDVATEKQDKLP